MNSAEAELPRLHVGDWFSDAVDWLTSNLNAVFDGIRSILETLVTDWLASALHWVPPVVLAVILGLIALAVRGPRFGLAAVIGMLFIQSIRLWDHAMDTLALVLVASVIAIVLAVPIGIAAARSSVVSGIVRPVLDFMQTMPAFVYLIPAVFFFSIGVTPGVVATIIFAMPPGVRLTELGIRQVDGEMVEAGHAFGASPRSILGRIQLPLAMPSVMAGVNQVIMLSLAMVVIAGMVGAGGLGADVYKGITTLNIGLGFEGGLAVVILAIYLDRLTAALGSRSAVARAQKGVASR